MQCVRPAPSGLFRSVELIRDCANISRMKAMLHGFLGLVSLSITLLAVSPGVAEAQNCNTTYSLAFNRIRTLSPRATDQNQADKEVRSLFGPRPDLCEAGAYASFLDSFVAFT